MVDQVKADEFGPNEFDQNYYRMGNKQPVVIKDEIANWEASNKWDPEYLDCVLGLQEVEVMFLEDEIYDIIGPKNIEEKSLPFAEARRFICDDGRYYLAQATIDVPFLTKLVTGNAGDFPRLADDIRTPRFLNDVSKRLHVTNLWFGGDKCKTPLHYDNKENFFLQVFGEKRVTMFSPSQTNNLYPARGEEHDHQSRVNVFDPDTSEYPRFENANSSEFVVEPGDMLYIPKGWWHAVETLTTSISINFWWSEPIQYVQHELDLLHNRLTSR